MGRRVVKKVNGSVQRKWIYLNSVKPIAELDASNRVVSTFVYATHPYVPDYMVRSGVTYRILSDHLGSVRMVVNTTDGTIAQQMDYDEWGNVTQDTNPDFQPFGFAAGHYDPQTRLTRFGYRDYDAGAGRWLAKDPILFGGGDPNLYAYCYNDPINFIDPWGLRLTNESDQPVVFKPEEPGLPVQVLPPHSSYPGNIDGVKPPAWNGDWLKVPGKGDGITGAPYVTIKPDGKPDKWYPFPDLGKITDPLPGRKKEPDWSERHPDWKK